MMALGGLAFLAAKRMIYDNTRDDKTSEREPFTTVFYAVSRTLAVFLPVGTVILSESPAHAHEKVEWRRRDWLSTLQAAGRRFHEGPWHSCEFVSIRGFLFQACQKRGKPDEDESGARGIP